MHTVHMTPTPTIEIEPEPPTKWDSAQAVLYTVGDPIDSTDVRRLMSAAEVEALTPRVFPLLGTSARRRWVASVAVEEPRDVARPLNERPALIRAIGQSIRMAGGLLLESEAHLGTADEAALVLGLASHLSGARSASVANGERPGTVTVGYLGASGGSRSATNYEFNLVPEAARSLRARYDEVLERRSSVIREDQLSEFLIKVCDVSMDSPTITYVDFATSSELFADLTSQAAAQYVRACRRDGAGSDRIIQMLRLFGFINPAGHRTWSKDDLARLERHRQPD